MRISDWSSDVCSSDLARTGARTEGARDDKRRDPSASRPDAEARPARPQRRKRRGDRALGGQGRRRAAHPPGRIDPVQRARPGRPDRQSVVEGKRETVRVNLGGDRMLNKKKKKNIQ